MAGAALNGTKVLILEDEFLIAMDVEQLCRDHGAGEVAILRSLADAEAAEIAGFDVAIIDILVDGRSSAGFAERLRERRVPFIFASGYDGENGVFARFPGVPVIGKPYVEGELIGAVLRVLREERGG